LGRVHAQAKAHQKYSDTGWPVNSNYIVCTTRVLFDNKRQKNAIPAMQTFSEKGGN